MPYYYLYALAIKVPLGTWVLVVLAAAVCVFPRGYAVSWRDELVLLAPAAVVLILVSSQTGFNHHLRYVLPVFPFALVWASKVARAVELRHRTIAALARGALLWSVASSLWVYPHTLSYFNELVGGPSNGHAHLLHSNIDWGQDLLYLKRWLEKHPEAQPLGLAFWNVYRPGIAGIEYLRPPIGPNALAGAPRDPDQAGPQPGWYAVSVNHLCSSRRRYDYFLHFRPVATAGYSILVYRITLEEANRVRREMNLGELSGSRAQSDGGPGDEGVY